MTLDTSRVQTHRFKRALSQSRRKWCTLVFVAKSINVRMYGFVMQRRARNTIARQNVLRQAQRLAFCARLVAEHTFHMSLATFYHFSVHPCADLYYCITVDVPATRDPMSRHLNVVLRDVLMGLVYILAIYTRKLSSWPIFTLFAYRFGLYISCFGPALLAIVTFQTTLLWRHNFWKHSASNRWRITSSSVLSAHI